MYILNCLMYVYIYCLCVCIANCTVMHSACIHTLCTLALYVLSAIKVHMASLVHFEVLDLFQSVRINQVCVMICKLPVSAFWTITIIIDQILAFIFIKVNNHCKQPFILARLYLYIVTSIEGFNRCTG